MGGGVRRQWPGGQEDGNAMIVRGGFQGCSSLSTAIKMHQYFNNWYSYTNDYRMNMGPLHSEFAFPEEFTLCLVP